MTIFKLFFLHAVCAHMRCQETKWRILVHKEKAETRTQHKKNTPEKKAKSELSVCCVLSV